MQRNEFLHYENGGMSLDQLARSAPSVAQFDKHPDLSDRYRPYPTIQFAEHAMKLGWSPVQAVEVRVRDKSMQGYQKHIVRFEHPDCRISESEYLHLLVTNATNGKLSFQSMLGVWRLICSNGLVIGQKYFSTPRIKHLNRTMDDVITLMDSIVKQAPMLSNDIIEMKETKLTQNEREMFAKSAAKLIEPPKDDEKIYQRKVFTPDLICGRRYDDRKTFESLWTTFNTIQENIMKGYFNYQYIDEHGINRGHRPAKAIKSIDRNIDINKSLWEMAETFKIFKQTGRTIQ